MTSSIMKISTASLHRLAYNAKIFQVGDSPPPMKLFFDEDDVVIMSVYDRLTYLEDSSEYESGDFQQYIQFGSAETKKLELALRDLIRDDEELTLTLGEFNMKVEIMGVLVGDYEYSFPEMDKTEINSLVEPEFYTPSPGAVALNPDRFRKLSLVQPGDYPVDFHVVEHAKFGNIVAFKKGPTVVGALSVIDRTILREQPGSEEFLW